METVGIVGVGAMGSALLYRLKLAGVPATVYDIDSKALSRAREMGAEIALSSAEVAEKATLIDVVVRTDREVLDAVSGRQGVLEGARPGALVLLHSTILPKTTLRVAEVAAPREVQVIDACMSAVPRAVREGHLSFLVGGPNELVERARPHLMNMGKSVLHVGPLGTGNVAKLIKNLVTGSETLVIHEAIQMGEAAGIGYRETLEMLRELYTGSVVNRWQNTFDPSGARSAPRAGTNIFNKDIPLAAELALQQGLELPIVQQLAAGADRLVRAQPSG